MSACPYVQPEWFCEKSAGHDGPHEMYVGPPVVTPSRADRQPPASASETKGGKDAVAGETTKRPDLVNHHEETT